MNILRGGIKVVLYMAVTADEYEIPLIVEERIVDLAEKMGNTPNNIASSICHAKKNVRKKYKKHASCKRVRYVRVEVDDDE